MDSSLALAGQGAANQVFTSIFWLIAFLPSVTTPLVAKAAAAGNLDQAQQRVCEATFLAVVMGVVGSMVLGFGTPIVLRLVLAPGAPALHQAMPYLRIRAISFIPALVHTVGIASFRGFKDTVTPLRVALVSNAINVLLDPVLMFWCHLGMPGAAAATVVAEVFAGITYTVLLFRRELLTRRRLFRVPSWQQLGPMLRGGAAVQMRTLAFQIAFVWATKQAQAMDPSGVSAAAYAISLLFWQLGGVALFALQSSASILIPAALGRTDSSGEDQARKVGDRFIVLGLGLGTLIGCFQLCTIPVLSAFSAIPEVRSAAAAPVAIASVISAIAGVVFAGEGVMIGRGAWGALAKLTCVSSLSMVAMLEFSSRFGLGLVGVWLAIGLFQTVNMIGVLLHHFVFAPRQAAVASLAVGSGEAVKAAA